MITQALQTPPLSIIDRLSMCVSELWFVRPTSNQPNFRPTYQWPTNLIHETPSALPCA